MLFRIDVAVFRWFNGFAGIWPLLDRAIFFCAQYLIFFLYALPLLLIAVAYFTRRGYPLKEHWLFSARIAGVALLARLFIAEPLRVWLSRLRPFAVLDGVEQLVAHPGGQSFPSGHTTLAFAIASVIALRYPRTGIACLVVAALIGASRIAAGVHWPSDVLAGMLIGAGSAVMVGYKLSRGDRNHKEDMRVVVVKKPPLIS